MRKSGVFTHEVLFFKGVVRNSGVFTHEVLYFMGVVRKKGVFTHEVKGCTGGKAGKRHYSQTSNRLDIAKHLF